MHSGYSWKGEYLVWDRASFRHSDLRTVSTSLNQRVGKLYVSRLCIPPKAGVIFPLKEHYEKINAELFDPRIVLDDLSSEEAQAARAPTFMDDPDVTVTVPENKSLPGNLDVKSESVRLHEPGDDKRDLVAEDGLSPGLFEQQRADCSLGLLIKGNR